MTVSVIMTGYNAEATIERAIRSVVAQTYTDWQLIVIDDGSTDATAGVLRRLESELNDPRLLLILGEPNVGPGGARNMALTRATGEWITFLDADDEYSPKRLETALAGATDNVDMIICCHTMVQPNGITRLRGTDDVEELSGREVAEGILADRFTSYPWDKLFRAKTVANIDFINVRLAEDKVYSIAAAVRADRVCFVDAPLVTYYVSSTSLTWSRIATIAETELLLRSLSEAAASITHRASGKRALRVARVSAYMNVARQAIANRQSPRSLPRQYSLRDLVATAKVNRSLALNALWLKLSARTFSLAHRFRRS